MRRKKKINLHLLTTHGHVEGSQRGSVLTDHKHKKSWDLLTNTRSFNNKAIKRQVCMLYIQIPVVQQQQV